MGSCSDTDIDPHIVRFRGDIVSSTEILVTPRSQSARVLQERLLVNNIYSQLNLC